MSMVSYIYRLNILQKTIYIFFILSLLSVAPSSYAVSASFDAAPNSNTLSSPSATGDDAGRVFVPSRLFTRRTSGEEEKQISERVMAADPNQVQAQKLEAKAQELLLREANEQKAATLTGSFADFVKSSVGYALPIYGQDLFVKNDRFGLGIDPISIPADYRVGPGDEIIVKAWGQVDIDFQGAVDRTGSIFIPKVGAIVVNGQRVADLLPLIAKTVAHKYVNFEMTVTLGQLRQIQYYMMGMAKVPGVHTTDSTATALHGLLVSGGALATGDLRAIELRRDNQVVAVIDAYKLLALGDMSEDPRLMPGDVIFIPPAKGFVAISGDVKQQAIYHLRKGMTLGELVFLAGGFNIKNSHPTIRVERVVNGKRVVDTIVYSDAIAARVVQDADIYLVSPVSPKIEQAISVRGNVAEPLRQPWHKGMHVSDIIKSPEQLVRPAVWTDRNNRNAFSRLENLNADANFKDSFPDINWSYATVERINPRTLETSVLVFELDKALAKDPAHDLMLEAGDNIVIYSTKDFKQPAYKELQFVKIEGEVNRPGKYSINAGETILDVINRAGGITHNAFLYGLVLSRESVRQQQSALIDLAADKVEEDAARYISTRATNSVSQADKNLDNVELAAARQLISRLRQTKTFGRVVLNISDIYATRNYINDIRVEDGDSITIPHHDTSVTVAGAVFQQTTLQWKKNAKPSEYIADAGGVKKSADRQGVLVMRADGSVWQAKGLFEGGRDVNPGDTIFVQEDIAKQSGEKKLGDWSQILYQMGLGALAIHALIGF